MNILVCTIMRNTSRYFDMYKNQLESFCSKFSEHEYNLSIYENDSTDDTKKLLSDAKFAGFESVNIKCEDIKTKFYGSVMDEDRVRNLANARNTAMGLNIEALSKSDIVLWVEPDVIYNMATIKSVLENSSKWDIFSPLSRLESGALIADSWATRLTENCVDSTMLNKTGLYKSGKIIEVWSTFNCICSYNSDGFKRGAKFGHINSRLGTWDCDTVVICEEFRKLGFNRIAVDTKISTRWY